MQLSPWHTTELGKQTGSIGARQSNRFPAAIQFTGASSIFGASSGKPCRYLSWPAIKEGGPRCTGGSGEPGTVTASGLSTIARNIIQRIKGEAIRSDTLLTVLSPAPRSNGVRLMRNEIVISPPLPFFARRSLTQAAVILLEIILGFLPDVIRQRWNGTGTRTIVPPIRSVR